ncbi:MAG: VOC family protein [Gammaproteobacteria bacterium]
MTDLRTLSADELGRLFDGFGINLLARRVGANAAFLRDVLQFEILRQSDDYAVLAHRGVWVQLHADATYARHPLSALLPEAGMRGIGLELRLYQVDPDAAEKRARAGGYEVLQASADKPHGLRECFLLDPDGYCWVPSVRLPARGKD